MVVSGMPESKHSSSTQQMAKSDLKAVQDLFHSHEDGYPVAVSCYRAGKKRDTPRLLIVTLKTPDMAPVLHNYGTGRRFPPVSEGLPPMWCNPDLIRADRIACYKARKLERKRKRRLHWNIQTTRHL